MKQQEYELLLEELEEIKRLWENKENISKLDYIKIYIKYLLFNWNVNRLRKKNK